MLIEQKMILITITERHQQLQHTWRGTILMSLDHEAIYEAYKSEAKPVVRILMIVRELLMLMVIQLP